MSNIDSESEIVRLQLTLAIANGFNCRVCRSTDFSYNPMGLIICNECAVVYHIGALKEIYKNEEME